MKPANLICLTGGRPARRRKDAKPRVCRCCQRDPDAEPTLKDRVAMVMGDDRRNEYKVLDMRCRLMERGSITLGHPAIKTSNYVEWMVRRMTQLLFRGEDPELIRAAEDTAVILLLGEGKA